MNEDVTLLRMSDAIFSSMKKISRWNPVDQSNQKEETGSGACYRIVLHKEKS